MRQIVLDTETTGLRVEEGHRIIEIGCVELINRKLTSKKYHQFINPQREIDAGAIAVHGITNESLYDKPFFAHIADEFMAFIKGAELIIHNAPFDMGFLNYEFFQINPKWSSLTDHCHIVDTLAMARQMHVGQRNSLDALCKRYGIDNSKRDLHGALLDANLLAQVYLAMTGGQGSFFETMGPVSTAPQVTAKAAEASSKEIKRKKLTVIRATEAEVTEHEEYLRSISEKE